MPIRPYRTGGSLEDAVSACRPPQGDLPGGGTADRGQAANRICGRRACPTSWARAILIDAVRAGNVHTGRQAKNHRAHRILRPLPNLSDSGGMLERLSD